MIVDTLACLFLTLGVVLGLSRGVADRLGLSPAEGLVAGAALSLVGAWAIAWAVFTSGAPLGAYWLIPAASAVSVAAGRRGLGRMASDPAARDLAVGQMLVTGWCVGWLSFVRNHSGGAWLGDWVEHWQRAHFFLREWPADRPFFDIYQLPARPPLANVLTAAFMRMTGTDYAHYQVIMAALCSLAYLPVGLLAQRFGGRPAARVAAVILMLSPLFTENSTYPWTKLQAAFFILTGFYFFLRVRDDDPHTGKAAIACALCLGGAVVTHYSAGPYVVVIAAAWIITGFQRNWRGGFAGTTLAAAAAGACVLAPWFIWSVARYGWAGTFLSNSTVGMASRYHGNPLAAMLLNLRDSLVPPQVRGYQGRLFSQASPWGALRDQCFLIYQLNPVLALGCVGWIVVAREAARAAGAAARRDRAFWTLSVLGIVAASFAAYGDRDHYGIGHICLQALVLLGLAFLASRWEGLGRGWRLALLAGWAVDFCLGIALQFAVEDFAIDRWAHPGLGLLEVSRSYNPVSQENLSEKIIAHLSFFADNLPTSRALVLLLLGSILGMAILRAGRTPPLADRP